MTLGHYDAQCAVIYHGLNSQGDPILTLLTTLEGYDASQPTAISDSGQWVAGYAEVYVEGSG